MTDPTLTLNQLIHNVAKARDDFTALSLEASAHLGNMAKERGALGEIREQLILLREPVRGWERTAWDAMWCQDANRAAYRNAEAAVRILNSQIGDLIWELFDFRLKGR